MPDVFADDRQYGLCVNWMSQMSHAGGDWDSQDVVVNDRWTTVANRLRVSLETFGDHNRINGPPPFL